MRKRVIPKRRTEVILIKACFATLVLSINSDRQEEFGKNSTYLKLDLLFEQYVDVLSVTINIRKKT